MGSLPHSSVPHSLSLDEQATDFLDDMRMIVSALQILGSGIIIRAGTGTPESVLSAKVGSLYLRTDGGADTTLYVKQTGTGNTGWVGK